MLVIGWAAQGRSDYVVSQVRLCCRQVTVITKRISYVRLWNRDIILSHRGVDLFPNPLIKWRRQGEDGMDAEC